jgi:hypothetical protein
MAKKFAGGGSELAVIRAIEPGQRTRFRAPAPLLVELPGIKPVTEITLTCGNAEFHDAKRRESA